MARKRLVRTSAPLYPEHPASEHQMNLKAMFTYEMPLILPGSDLFFNIEDDVVVTKTGVENMSSMVTREPRVRL